MAVMSGTERRVFATIGGAKGMDAIVESVAGVGLNPYERNPPEGVPVEFVDYPFNQDWNGDHTEYLDIIRRVQPRVAVAPDVMDGRGLSDEFLTYADRLNRFADHVVVVPKSVHPERVPDRFRLGIPCANGWGDSTWGWGEYADHAGGVHLLGGTPNTHLEILRDTDVDARSVDTSSFMVGCRFNVWDGKWIERDEYGVDYYQAISMSLNNLHRALNRFAATW